MPTFTHRAGAASPFARGSAVAAVAPAGQAFSGTDLSPLRNLYSQGQITTPQTTSGPVGEQPPTYVPPPPPPSGGIGAWWSGLSTVEQVALVGGGLALIGGAGYAIYRSRAAKAPAAARRRR